MPSTDAQLLTAMGAAVRTDRRTRHCGYLVPEIAPLLPAPRSPPRGRTRRPGRRRGAVGGGQPGDRHRAAEQVVRQLAVGRGTRGAVGGGQLGPFPRYRVSGIPPRRRPPKPPPASKHASTQRPTLASIGAMNRGRSSSAASGTREGYATLSRQRSINRIRSLVGRIWHWVRGRLRIADLVRGAAEGLGLDSIRLDLAGRSSPLSAQVLRSAQWSLRSVYRTSAGDGRVAAR